MLDWTGYRKIFKLRHYPFLSLAKTCDKLGIAVWDYLGSRLRVAGHTVVEPLDDYVRARNCSA